MQHPGDVWIEFSFEPSSDTDGNFRWFEHLGGTRYREFTREGDGELQLAGLNTPALTAQPGPSRRECLRACLQNKMRSVFRDSAITAGASLFGCAFTMKLYFACVGITTLSVMAFSLIYEFVVSDSCGEQCPAVSA